MRCITLTQPYATLVALGQKKIETRNWSTSYRGPLGIHAGAGLGPVGGKKGLLDLISTEPFWSVLRQAFYVPNVGYPADAATIAHELDYGAIVAVCELAGCQFITGRERRFALHDWFLTDQERAFGDYAPGRFAWLLSNIRMLPEPVPCKGALSLWTPDTLTQAAITCQLIAATST